MFVLTLPQELFDRIVDFLHDDHAALRACALAHSCLRGRSQQHLFRALALSSPSGAACVGALLRAAPALAAAVRVLALRDSFAPRVLHSALDASLPTLHTLRLDAHAALADGARAPCALRGLESTQRLVIGHTDFAHAGQIATLLRALPRVSALAFVVRSHVRAPAPAMPPLPRALALTYLDLRGLFQTEVLAELARWLCAPGARALARLETLCTNASPFIPPPLLAAAAPTLQELRVRQLVDHPGLEPTDLPPLPALTRFSINAFDRYTRAAGGADEAATAAFVRALGARAPALAHVRVLATVVDFRGAPLTGVRWSAALAFVAHCRRRQAGAPALRAVTVELAVRSLHVPELCTALDLAEREALALRELADELRALPGIPRLILHARSAEDESDEGPMREILHGLADTTDSRS